MVTIEWDDGLLPLPQSKQNELNEHVFPAQPGPKLQLRPAKIAQFHMVALTEAISTRRGRISGTTGEIAYDSATIRVSDFRSGTEVVYKTPSSGRGHDGGDEGLALAFVRAVGRVKRGEMGAEEAQKSILKCTVEELLRSHLAVFWVVESRIGGTALRWQEWWAREVEMRLREMGVKGRV